MLLPWRHPGWQTVIRMLVHNHRRDPYGFRERFAGLKHFWRRNLCWPGDVAPLDFVEIVVSDDHQHLGFLCWYANGAGCGAWFRQGCVLASTSTRLVVGSHGSWFG